MSQPTDNDKFTNSLEVTLILQPARIVTSKSVQPVHVKIG